MKNTQFDQNNQKRVQTIMKTRIEKSINAKIKKIQLYLDLKLNQMMNLIQSRVKTVENQDSKNSNSNSLISLILR